MRLRALISGSFAVALSASALSAQRVSAEGPTTLAPLKVIDTSFMNRKVSACTDFFAFANGGWLARDTIPAAYSTSGVARDMTDRNQLAVRSVLDDAMAKRASNPPTSTQYKLGTFYASCMDSTAIERAGATPIKATLTSIDAVNSRPALLDEIARLQMKGVNVAFSYGPSVDVHDAARYIATFDRGGLGLPDRDYYIKKDPASDSMRLAYVAHIAKLFTLVGEDPATAHADATKILELETELAKAELERVARRDPR